MTDPTNPYAAAAAAHYAPLGAQVNNWVNQSAQNIPALQPTALNPGMGGPLRGQQHYVPPSGIPAIPGGAPAVALPPTAAPAATPVNTQFPLNPGTVDQDHPNKHEQQFTGHWQDRLAHMQQYNPEQYARRLPMVQQMMQRRGFQFTPPQATPLTTMPLNPNPPIA